MKILIATATVPKDFKVFCEQLREIVAETGVTKVINGILWTEGPGCSNLAFEVEGPDDVCESIGKGFCMALMPAKWCETKDDLPAEDTCLLNDHNTEP